MDQQTTNFDVRYFLNAILNGKWIIVATTVLGMTLAIASNYFQTLSYRAAGQIQIDAPASLPSPGTDLMAQNNYYLNIDRYFQTQKQKMSSRKMHLLFAERLKRLDNRYRGVPTDSIAGEIGGGLAITPVEDTNLLNISFTTGNAEKAAEWLNIYLDLFVEENARVQEESVKQNREILVKQLEDVKNLVSAQQEQVNRYVEGADAVNRAATTAGDGDFLFRFQEAYDEARRKRMEEEQKLARLEPYTVAGTDLSSLPTFDFSPNARSLNDRYVEAKAAVDRLRREGKGEEHPAMVAKKVDVRNLQEQLQFELRKYVDGLRLNISALKAAEGSALQGYREKLSERQAASRQLQEADRLSRVRDNWSNASALIEEKLRSLRVMESFITNNVSVVERAQANPAPVSRRGRGFVILVGFGGFILGAAIVLAGEMLNPKVKTVEEIHSNLNVPALGFLPSATDFSINQIRESYNVLRTELLFRRDMHQHRSLMVTSSLPQEGKTTVVMNLAKTLAAAGDRTVVVDFDLRKARLRSLMSTGSMNGKTLFSPVEGLNLRLETTDTRTLHIIVPATLPKHPPFVLSQPEVREMVEYLRTRYDWVLVDAPPVASVTDPVIIASFVDTILFVIKHNFVDKRVVRNALASLTKVNADIMGAVLNDVDVRKLSYYSYQSYYRYYSDSDAK